MKLGDKLTRLRTLEGFARGLGREMTQAEVGRAVREELEGQISQSYLSQLESGARTHMTGNTRLLLARLFRVHPGHLVDDLDDIPDLWLIEAAEEYSEDRHLADALVKIAKHPHSRECLILLGSIVENARLIDRLIETLSPPPQPSRKKRKG
jgi:transcriptional regulator with XRE-family HTH domain